MILVDYSGICMGAYFARGSGPDEGLLRHFILNSLRMHNAKFKDEYGKMVLCCDGGSWRKDVFPEYKANRKKDRETSDHDWPDIFEKFTKIRNEINEHLPFDVIHEYGVEADDIIATLVQETQEFGKHEPIMIISADKDFIQLQKYNNIKQYSPLTRKFITDNNPIRYQFEHTLKGDSSDGVPNVLSDDDALCNDDKRQSPLSKKKIESWWENRDNLQTTMPEHIYRNFQRNDHVINLDRIPEDLKTKILSNYESIKSTPNMKVLNYLVVNRLNNLIESVGDFHRP
tara:strand:- start:1357 stop:2214 length:858 start_codon:yes stop_codon:yes gene_type:complete